MDDSIFTKKDLDEISGHGMSPKRVLSQIAIFKRGVPFTHLVKPCTENDGITLLNNSDIEEYTKIYSDAQGAGRCMKFVPASGAASRMFKLLLEVYDSLKAGAGPTDASANNKANSNLNDFIGEIKRFAFYDDLQKKMSENGKSFDTSIENNQVKTVLDHLLFEEGLNLSNIPKGLIPFHRYKDHSRTPFEEHLVEAFNYTRDNDGKVNIHFTVSPQHEKNVKGFIKSVLNRYEKNDAKYNISFSCQKPGTDTIAVDLNNMPFRDDENAISFRPGGHGALIENLSDLKGDIVFIKNIDNVVIDRFKSSTYKYKKALGGFLITLQSTIFQHLRTLTNGQADDDFIKMLFTFIPNRLSVIPPENILSSTLKDKKEYLISRLNRPLRVCGMVKNTGEPGGGPFWVTQSGEGISIQIVETSQVDMDNADQKNILNVSTHFNPVDLVCGVRDYNGKPFDLTQYVDNDTGFISPKSKNGRELKALELPGLWNGSMAYWNTVFVAVPAVTFSPVKTVFDLLNDEHQTL